MAMPRMSSAGTAANSRSALPYDGIPRIWGGAANGETCDGCDLIIETPDIVMEGIALNDESTAHNRLDRRRPLQLHVLYFSLWDSERRR
jgi:hypothetical protein